MTTLHRFLVFCLLALTCQAHERPKSDHDLASHSALIFDAVVKEKKVLFTREMKDANGKVTMKIQKFQYKLKVSKVLRGEAFLTSPEVTAQQTIVHSSSHHSHDNEYSVDKAFRHFALPAKLVDGQLTPSNAALAQLIKSGKYTFTLSEKNTRAHLHGKPLSSH